MCAPHLFYFLKGKQEISMANKRLPLIKGLILSLLLLLCGVSSADTQPYGEDGLFVAGVPTNEFVDFAAPETAGRQKMKNWCWAACVQMVLNYHGLYVQQQDVVSRIFGSTVDEPANGEQILAALSGWAPDSRGRRSAIRANANNHDHASIIRDLDKKWPLIVGLEGARGIATGHAYVLTAAYFKMDNFGNPVIQQVVLRDPFPGFESRTVLNADDFWRRLQFMTSVYVERL